MLTVMPDALECGRQDARTFIALLAAHGQSLYRFIYTLLPDPHEAQDVYQECVMTLWEKFGEYRDEEPFLPWAYRFAHFKVLAQRSAIAARPLQLDDDVLAMLAEVQVEENEHFEEQLRALTGCMERLKPEERRLLRSRYEAAASLRRVAEETERRADSLYRALHRVRRKLLHCIQHRLALEGRP